MARIADSRVDAVRRFNRFYTQRIGILRPQLYGSPWSLTEVRVLYELAHASAPMTATDIAHRLGLDAGYLSRILRGFVARGYVRKARAEDDERHLYEDAGFRLTREERHHSFGKDLVGQMFVLDFNAITRR